VNEIKTILKRNSLLTTFTQVVKPVFQIIADSSFSVQFFVPNLDGMSQLKDAISQV
jgi:hypothetical protein